MNYFSFFRLHHFDLHSLKSLTHSLTICDGHCYLKFVYTKEKKYSKLIQSKTVKTVINYVNLLYAWMVMLMYILSIWQLYDEEMTTTTTKTIFEIFFRGYQSRSTCGVQITVFNISRLNHCQLHGNVILFICAHYRLYYYRYTYIQRPINHFNYFN